MNNKIIDEVFSSIHLITDRKLQGLNLDRTIIATISNHIDVSKNQYIISYQGIDYDAYSSTNQLYNIGDSVLVLIPENSFSNKKIILMKSSKESESIAYIDDNSWNSYTPNWTSSSGSPQIGNGSLIGRYKNIGKTVFFNILLTGGSTTNWGSGDWRFSLPLSSQNTHYIFSGSAQNKDLSWYLVTAPGQYILSTDIFSVLTSVSGNSLSPLNSTTPFSWGVGDTLSISGVYESI